MSIKNIQWKPQGKERRKNEGKKRLYCVQQCNGEQFRSAAQLGSLPMNFSRGLTKKEVSNYNLWEEEAGNKTKTDDSTQCEQTFIQWLLRQTKKIGDNFPHRDGLKGLEISLPYLIKEILHFLFLAFIAYLVEMEVFDSLKANYLFVGLTATGILHQ